MTALASITQDWYNATDSGSVYNGVHVVFIDFRKAFDLVDHGVLLTKLAGMGITKSFLKWTQSYLSGRAQQVKLPGVLSRHGEVIAGVISPTLFNVHVNDIEDCIPRGIPVSTCKYPANTHVSSIVSKVCNLLCKRIHYLRVCRKAHLPRDIGLTTYITKIRPVLEYASPVWRGPPIYLDEDIQRVQNRCLNVIGLPRDTVESLVTGRQNLTRKEFKRILESEAHPCKRFLDKPVDHGHNLRSCKTNPAHLRIPVSRTVRHKQSFIPRGDKLNLI